MTRCIVAAFVLGLYVAGSCWIVRSEGRAYRAALRRQQQAAARPAAEPDVAPGTSDVARSVSSEAKPAEDATEPSRPIEPVPPRLAAAETEASPSPAPASPAPSKTAPEVEKPSVASGAAGGTPAQPAPAGDGSAPIAQILARDPFWNAPEMKREWALAELSVRDEIELGRALHGLVMHFSRPQVDGPWLRRVEDASEPLLETCIRKEISYTFTVLDSDEVNAFSHPGGYVYVTRGLFNLIGEDEDYALRFVLGHEIAHVDLQHALGCLRDPAVKTLGIGTLPQFYFLIFPLGYTEEQDYEADRWVYNRMMQFGHTRRESLAFLRKLEGYARNHGFENERPRLKPGPGASLLENHLKAHPLARARLKRLTTPPKPQPKPAAAPAR